MSIFNLFKHEAATTTGSPAPDQTSYAQHPDKAGLLVAGELEKALEECKTNVARIAAECRAKNRRFRDHEFDLENDSLRCLHGLGQSLEVNYTPSDVQRVTQIFEKPQFFPGKASSSDIIQGLYTIGDCWFVSALATMATWDGLVEKFCVARDEQIGIYGFVFFRNASWVNIIIDDFLFTSIPKYEELSFNEKQLYHHNKEKFNKEARKNGKVLYFARPGADGGTWVPLIEKAYAKLHGSYASLHGGQSCEAIEDLTGGVSTIVSSNDILDVDKFWTDELCKANVDRLFGCAYQTLANTRNGGVRVDLSGLHGNHAYSVLRAVEYKGKRFVVIRNPWGESEWTGPWSDGAKEWMETEWQEALPALGHTFGDDGQFVMEYKDFLECWDQIDRTLLFDCSWVMSSQWLQVTAKPFPSAWTYGDISFTFSLPAASPAVIVLSQLDDRYFREIAGRCYWTFDFILFKKGEKQHVGVSSASRLGCRSVNLEVDRLEAGDYVVHVRLDRRIRSDRPKDYYESKLAEWDQRSLSRALTERAESRSIASNFHADVETKNLAIPLNILAGQDLSELEQKAHEIAKAKKEEEEKSGEEGRKTDQQEGEGEDAKIKNEAPATSVPLPDDGTVTTRTERVITTVTKKGVNGEVVETKTTVVESVGYGPEAGSSDTSKSEDPPKEVTPFSTAEEDDSIFLGLKVYTKKEAPVEISGQLRHEMEVSAALALK
ncbi:cysteine proteinase [Marasmius fiardii PR-910]|nr:cysteine proteinase [Marasmius fiardii PR-910]